MKQFVAIESSSGTVYIVNAKDMEQAFVEIGVQVLKMDRDTIDTGNVDFDLTEVCATDKPSVVKVS